MDSQAAELSSLASALEDLTRRIGAIGGHYSSARREDVAQELVDVERALEAAARRLSKVAADARAG